MFVLVLWSGTVLSYRTTRRRHSKKPEVLAQPGSRIALLSDVIQETTAPEDPGYYL